MLHPGHVTMGAQARAAGKLQKGVTPSPPRLRDRRTDALQDNPEVLSILSKLRNLNLKDISDAKSKQTYHLLPSPVQFCTS